MEQERENYVPLISEFQQQTIATSRSPCEQVLQQQALHQQALHQQSLKQHSMDFKPKPSSFRTSPVKSEPILADFEETKCVVQEKKDPIKPVREMIIADLNVDPPESEGEELAAPVDPVNFDAHLDSTRNTNDENDQVKNSITVKDTDIMEGEGKKFMKLGKCRSRLKGEYPLESGPDTDADQQCQGVSTSREEKVSSLKAGLVHVARKMPKNAHAHFILGLMYQRLGQPQKAVSAFEKSSEILQQPEEEIGRPELLSLVQIHHAQCLLQGTAGDGSDKELETEELEDLVLKLKESVKLDVRQAAVWNTLGLMLLRSGRLQSGITVLSSLTSVAPDFLDSLANLGIAYLQSGNLELSAKCFQDLVLKDQNHPGALINYGALLLCQYGSIIAGAGANGGEGAYATQIAAANVAQECLAAAVKADPKAGHIWVNLANAYYMTGDHRSAGKCLEQATKLEPNRMSTRYAVALHRIKDAERSQDPTEQLSWAANEMASILREGDPTIVELRIAWAGLAMVHRAQHEIAAAFETRQMDLKEVEERALYTLKQAIEEDPDDAVQWHQLGLHTLCTLQFKTSQDYLKAAVARSKDCSYAWSNLGISLQLSEDPSQAEEVYKRALTLATPQQAHAIFSNVGNLYRQQKRFEDARMMFARSLELCPGYAPAYNNLGLVFVAEGQWEDAKTCFDKALLVDPLLDAAKSNLMKAVAMSRICATKDSSLLQEKITTV